MALNRKIKEIINDITGKREIKKLQGRDLSKPNKAFLKDAYIFNYPRPKTKKSLVYWDPNPIILIVARQGSNRILGLNLNHIPWTIAIQIAKRLERKAKNKKRAIKYVDIKSAIKSAKLPEVYYMIALKSYLLDRISGNVFALEMGEYSKAIANVPRKFKKKGLSAAIRLNQAKVFAYIKMKNKKRK